MCDCSNKSLESAWFRAEIVALALLLATCLIMVGLVACGDTSSIQRAQVAAAPSPTPRGTSICRWWTTIDPRHLVTNRQYTTWCGPTCYSVVTEQIEAGEIETWDPASPPPTPSSPYQDPRTPRISTTVCEPVEVP